MNSFHGIEIGKKSLLAHQYALNTTGHNVANVNTPGYSRQQVVMTSEDPLYYPASTNPKAPGQVGTGVMVEFVKRIRDYFLDDRIDRESQYLGKWEKRNEILHQIELLYNEPQDTNIRTALDAFWTSWETLSNDPESLAARAVVRERAQGLIDVIKHLYDQFARMRDDINKQMKTRVEEINQIGQNIAKLNMRITAAVSANENPNDLLDKRDLLTDQLSKIINIQVSRQDPDDFRINAGGMTLVQGNKNYYLYTKPDTSDFNMVKIYWDGTDEEANINNGELQGMFEGRDELLVDQMALLDELAITLVDRFNEVHKNGFGLNGSTDVNFFEDLRVEDQAITAGTKYFKITGKQSDSATYIFDPTKALNDAVNFDGAIENGTIKINDFGISYDADNDSIYDIIKRINDKDAGVVATLTPTGRLGLTATRQADYTISNIKDVNLGNILMRLGILDSNGVVSGDTQLVPKLQAASFMQVSKDIRMDLNKIAAAKGEDLNVDGIPDASKGVGNGENALALAELKHGALLNKGATTFEDFFASIITTVGTSAEESERTEENQNLLIKNLENLRQSVSGVSLDEEMANMIMFQNGYNAAARVINVMNEMLDVIMNLGSR